MEPEVVLNERPRLKVLVPLLTATVSVWSVALLSLAQAMVLS